MRDWGTAAVATPTATATVLITLCDKVYFECSASAALSTTPTSMAPTYIKISTNLTYTDYVLILHTHIPVLLLRTQLNLYNAYH